MSEPFERAAVLARFNNDSELLKELVSLFKKCSAAWLEEIGAALSRGDFQEAQRVAHTLKGSIGNFLAHEAIAAAAALERVCQAGVAEPARHAVDETKLAVLRLQSALELLAKN